MAEEGVIEGFRSVGGEMVMGVAEFGGVGPHEGGNLIGPEGNVIAAGKHGKEQFGSRDNFEGGDGQIRGVCAGVPQGELHLMGGGLIREEAQKIADVAKFDGECGGDALGARSGAGISHHFEDVGAPNFEAGRGQIIFHKIAAAKKAVLLAIECGENDRERGTPEAARGRAAKQGCECARVVIRAGTAGDRIVVSADEEQFAKMSLGEGEQTSVASLALDAVAEGGECEIKPLGDGVVLGVFSREMPRLRQDVHPLLELRGEYLFEQSGEFWGWRRGGHLARMDESHRRGSRV